MTGMAGGEQAAPWHCACGIAGTCGAQDAPWHGACTTGAGAAHDCP